MSNKIIKILTEVERIKKLHEDMCNTQYPGYAGYEMTKGIIRGMDIIIKYINNNSLDVGKLENCHDCDAKPGEVHSDGCDVEICSVCGDQKMCCDCEGHDKEFAKWTGIFPGAAEADYLGIDLNEFNKRELDEIFLIKKAK